MDMLANYYIFVNQLSIFFQKNYPLQSKRLRTIPVIFVGRETGIYNLRPSPQPSGF